MAAFSSNIDITSGGTYAMDVTNGETSSKVATDLNGKFANIQELLQNGLPEVWTGSSLPDSLPNGKVCIYNNNLYFGYNNNIISLASLISNNTLHLQYELLWSVTQLSYETSPYSYTISGLNNCFMVYISCSSRNTATSNGYVHINGTTILEHPRSASNPNTNYTIGFIYNNQYMYLYDVYTHMYNMFSISSNNINVNVSVYLDSVSISMYSVSFT